MAPGARDWRMHGENVPLFTEYLQLAESAGWGELMELDDIDVGPTDALVVVDMQNDFVPINDLNPEGGAFGVAEGDSLDPLISKLIARFGDAGGMVAATRDYHPLDHCSFLDNGGHFPSHCLQGGIGSYFYKPIGDRIFAEQHIPERRIEVFFKGFHEDTDSFGAFPYPDDPDTLVRLCHNDPPVFGLHGCSLDGWTGAELLHCTCKATDVNAPPDVLAVYHRKGLGDWFREGGIKRVFVCGLALDFCVLDTCLNGAKAGFAQVFMIMDATRAAHLPAIGTVGSGFLSDVAELRAKMAGHKVQIVPSAALLPDLPLVSPWDETPKTIADQFPKQLGPFSLVPAMELVIELDLGTSRYKVVEPVVAIQSLSKRSIKAEGYVSAAFPLSLPPESRARFKIPDTATQYLYAYPIDMRGVPDRDRAYFATESAPCAFFVYGGYVYMDEQGRVLRVLAISVGDGLKFAEPSPWHRKYSEALAGRWQPVTIPFLAWQTGVRQYAMIGPGERVTDVSGEVWPTDNPHGGFVFLFHDDPDVSDERDVFFPIQKTSRGRHKLTIGKVAHEITCGLRLQNGNSFDGMNGNTQHYKDLLVGAFEHFDKTKSGFIDEEKVSKAIGHLLPDLSTDTLKLLFKKAGTNKDGAINYTALVDYLFRG